MITVRDAANPSDISTVRILFEEYQAALGIDLEFQQFSAEVETLPGVYARPGGRLLLAEAEGVAAGCVAMRAVDEQRCEMKRLYVRGGYRALGVGRMLAERVIEEARSAGYIYMVLDTLPTMGPAQRLYASLGFLDIEPYRYNPIAGTRYMRLAL